MTMREEIKSAIEEIMDSQVSEIEDAVEAACKKVDSAMDYIEEKINSVSLDLSEIEGTYQASEELDRLQEKL